MLLFRWAAQTHLTPRSIMEAAVWEGPGSHMEKLNWITLGLVPQEQESVGTLSGQRTAGRCHWFLCCTFLHQCVGKICHSALTKHHSPLPGIPLRSYPGPSNTHAQAGTPPKQLQTSHIQWLALAHTADFPKLKWRNKGICSKGNRTKSQKKERIKMETSNLTDKRVQHQGYKAAQWTWEKNGWNQWELQLRQKTLKKTSKIKNAINEMKNTLEEIKSKLNDAKDQIGDLEDKVVKITSLEQKKNFKWE